MKMRLQTKRKHRASANLRRMAKIASSVGPKVQFKPTRGTHMAESVKPAANRLDNEQRLALATIAKLVIGGGTHAKAAAHRR